MITDVFRNMNLFVDGVGYAGKVEELNLPKLTLKTEEFRGGGMNAPVEIDLGLEKLECEFTLLSFDSGVLKLFGLAPGNIKPLTIRGALASAGGTIATVVVNLRGQIRELDPGTWKPGDAAKLKITMALRYYKLTHGGSVVHEIDPEHMIQVIDGTDQLAATRTALGI